MKRITYSALTVLGLARCSASKRTGNSIAWRSRRRLRSASTVSTRKAITTTTSLMVARLVSTPSSVTISSWVSRARSSIRAPKTSRATVPGVAFRKSFEEWGGAIRAGVMVTPSTLVYAKGGFVVNEQRKYFEADNPFGSYYNHYRTKGCVVGGGVEQMLGERLYVKAEGRYANYKTNSSRLTGLIGLGVLFGPSAEPVVIAPPPPPPPPVEVAPATQTCPDGSVILATEVCPAPPPYVPPAPPEPAPERG